MRTRTLFLLACAIALVACKLESRVLPLPTLPNGRVPIRVAYVVNPRLPKMSLEQIQTLLTTLQKATKENFGVVLEFAPIDVLPIASVFEKIPDKERREYTQGIYDFRKNADPQTLEAAFGTGFKESGESLVNMFAYSRPYIGEIAEKSYSSLGAALAKYELHGIERWHQIAALDGKPSLDDHPYNEYMLWVALGYGDFPYELVLTNQMIASVEMKFPAVHAALRGGYSNGVTTYNKLSRYGTMSVWSTYAFTSKNDWVVKLREGEVYGDDEAARLAGVAATHEIGHQLFHFLHPYAQTACVMYPVPMLAFRHWAEGLSAEKCKVGSFPEMQPGAYQFRY